VVGVNYEYSPGHWWRNIVRSKTKTGWCNRPGDSGAPVYIVSGSDVYAKGILDGAGGGGSDYYGGTLDKCKVDFTDIYQAYYGFPGAIRTG
jgi:streptogrisin C